MKRPHLSPPRTGSSSSGLRTIASPSIPLTSQVEFCSIRVQRRPQSKLAALQDVSRGGYNTNIGVPIICPGRGVTSLVAMIWKVLLFTILVDIQPLKAESLEKTEVVALLYDNVTLPCSFPFIQGSEGLSVVWERMDKDGRKFIIAYKFIDGQDNLADQDINYTGRTELTREFSQGKADLILQRATFSDEGTYFCRAANIKGHGDKEVELTISGLNAGDATVTVVHIDGKKCLKCINTGMFRNPWVKWYDIQGKDLSEHGTRNITVLGDGRKMVESVLALDAETNKHYVCQVKEGRLKRSARAVISDGEPVILSETKLPE